MKFGALAFLAVFQLAGQITITPASVSLRAGQIKSFSASPSCVWSAQLGTITPSGLYQAPAFVWSAETDTVTCSAGALGTVTASVTLAVSQVNGMAWYRTIGSIAFLNPSNPLYINTTTGLFGLDFDSTYFQLTPSTSRPGQTMLSFIPPSPPQPSPLVNVALSGTIIGTVPTLNLLPGNGITWTCVNDSTLNSVDCTPSINFAVALAISIAQSGVALYCNSQNGTTAYTCSLSGGSRLLTYSAGMVLFLNVDTTCSGGCSLDVDGVGIVSIKQIDGATDPGGALIANQPRWIAFNGTVWLLIQ